MGTREKGVVLERIHNLADNLSSREVNFLSRNSSFYSPTKSHQRLSTYFLILSKPVVRLELTKVNFDESLKDFLLVAGYLYQGFRIQLNPALLS